MKLHYLQHIEIENPGYILDWAAEKGATLSSTRFFESDYSFPDVEAIDALVVMGGPMGVYDEDKYPWLIQEKQFLKAFIETGKPVLGICLGSQLLAEVLGGRVYPGTKEIGWMPVIKVADGQFFKDFPSGQTVMHWHGDTFDLPHGATLLASSDPTKHQAFEYGNCLALQFHFEMTSDNVRDLLEHEPDDLTDDPYVQTEQEILAGAQYFEENKAILFDILNRLFSRL